MSHCTSFLYVPWAFLSIWTHFSECRLCFSASWFLLRVFSSVIHFLFHSKDPWKLYQFSWASINVTFSPDSFSNPPPLTPKWNAEISLYPNTFSGAVFVSLFYSLYPDLIRTISSSIFKFNTLNSGFTVNITSEHPSPFQNNLGN